MWANTFEKSVNVTLISLTSNPSSGIGSSTVKIKIHTSWDWSKEYIKHRIMVNVVSFIYPYHISNSASYKWLTTVICARKLWLQWMQERDRPSVGGPASLSLCLLRLSMFWSMNSCSYLETPCLTRFLQVALSCATGSKDSGSISHFLRDTLRVSLYHFLGEQVNHPLHVALGRCT